MIVGPNNRQRVVVVCNQRLKLNTFLIKNSTSNLKIILTAFKIVKMHNYTYNGVSKNLIVCCSNHVLT